MSPTSLLAVNHGRVMGAADRLCNPFCPKLVAVQAAKVAEILLG